MPRRLPCQFGQNNLLFTLSRDDRALIEPNLKPVTLDRGTVLEEPGKPVQYACFIRSGVGSTVATNGDGRQVEVGLFGCEGMSGTAAVLQADRSPNQTFMQVAGHGDSIRTEILRELLDQSPTLRRHLLRYAQTMFTQVSQTAVSNGLAKLEQRLARWLLMCHDRMRDDTLSLTHEFMSIMLGVRRAGVTVAIHVLEGKGLIRASRGRIEIVDRDGLESEAKHSYGVSEAEYARLIGFGRPGGSPSG